MILWRSANTTYTDPVSLFLDDKVLVPPESETVSPNFFSATLRQPDLDAPQHLTQVTYFLHKGGRIAIN